MQRQAKQQEEPPCEVCDGSGFDGVDDDCRYCDGKGTESAFLERENREAKPRTTLEVT